LPDAVSLGCCSQDWTQNTSPLALERNSVMWLQVKRLVTSSIGEMKLPRPSMIVM
jgi:hypothetical protein